MRGKVITEPWVQVVHLILNNPKQLKNVISVLGYIERGLASRNPF